MLKKIEILIQLGFSYRTEWRPVWAWVEGNLAIHRTLYFLGWTVTHIPSGCAIARADTKAEILQKFRYFQNFTYRGKKVLDKMKVCDLLFLAPDMVPWKEENLKYWQRNYLPAIERAHECNTKWIE